MASDLIERLTRLSLSLEQVKDRAVIEDVITALAVERERVEKAERMLALHVENPEAERYWEGRWRDAEASLAEARALLTPFADIYGRLAPEPGEDAMHPDDLGDESLALSFPKLGDIRAAARFLAQEEGR